jgi:choline-glycine betaine transporter
MTIWSILRLLEIFYFHLVYFVVIYSIFPHFGISDKEKSGNPVEQTRWQQQQQQQQQQQHNTTQHNTTQHNTTQHNNNNNI